MFEGHGDVGTVLHAGGVEYDDAGKRYTVAGSGENMWFAKDAFHFVWKKASGDLSLAADVAFPRYRYGKASQGVPDGPAEPGR